ncbi:hypothetical protein G7K_0920-t1 [Saitoella complicata NRRL Y-17804]|uniref:STAS domain-containing protein n=1 Tax=Saitoella complicata (strain BCRC 22490 / CBS 7301 / JCM 7358 / NBRC 10748 / NRRL Y-17804) TaxID=698492 RepID=A0A0E9NAG0_SAICN|nr:hypothetical protein G7K_0920-t1 [Saitoella complicata NRRL Y-17804]
MPSFSASISKAFGASSTSSQDVHYNAREIELIDGSGQRSVVAESYVERDPSVKQYLRNICPHPAETAKNYFISLFPIASWIHRYNTIWFLGDLIAGITVGAVVVPQGMAYAKIAQLAPQFGLYSSFVGVMLYFMFATSKDITIGPVAVMSLLTGNIIDSVQKDYPGLEGHVIASGLAVIAGAIVTALGLLRLGFIVDFIPLPAIAAFMTGSAINIAAGQVPGLMGITGFSTREATYKVIINTLKHLGRTQLDAAFGLTALLMLYLIRFGSNYAGKRWPRQEKAWFFVGTLRTAFVILLYTMLSWLVNRNHRKTPLIAILKTVPRGFQNMGVPKIDSNIISAFASYLPSAVIVLLIEHIAISKSFGRVNGYTIDPNQELIAIGITNLFGPFFGAYPATGSFSRTAIKAKAGVRTPLAGVITGIVVILAIYLLPPVFYYIPSAALSAVIIHAVLDLIASPRTLLAFWRASPPEFVIFWIGVIVTIFSTIENGIYTTVATSAALMLFRIAKAQGTFLGQVHIRDTLDSEHSRSVYVPLDNSDGSNPLVKPAPAPPGIFVYRLNEGFLYPNASHFTDHMVREILRLTRPGNPNPYGSLGNRPWNDPGPRHKIIEDTDSRPPLRAVILDFGGVPHLDVTGLQNLIDVRAQLDRHAGVAVPWHFAQVRNGWIKRALVSGGFGQTEQPRRSVFSVANVGVQNDPVPKEAGAQDEEIGVDTDSVSSVGKIVPLLSVNRPYFHADLDEAVKAAVLESEDVKA